MFVSLRTWIRWIKNRDIIWKKKIFFFMFLFYLIVLRRNIFSPNRHYWLLFGTFLTNNYEFWALKRLFDWGTLIICLWSTYIFHWSQIVFSCEFFFFKIFIRFTFQVVDIKNWRLNAFDTRNENIINNLVTSPLVHFYLLSDLIIKKKNKNRVPRVFTEHVKENVKLKIYSWLIAFYL